MTSIVIPESVVTIEYGSFYYCKNLTSITIPSSVTSIGENAFYGCCQLDEIHIKCSTPPSIGSNVFYDVSTNIPVHVPCGSLLSYSGWGGFTDIRGESEKVKIGSLWYLLDCANHSATVVPELSVPQQITSPRYSNHSCPSGDITIPASVGYGNQTFAVTAIGDGAFAYCQNISSIVIPESVTSIGNSAFAHCLDIASVVIPEGVTTIGNSAFYYCIELESVTIPNSMTGIGNEAFMNCDNLESLTIGNSVTSIGNEAFRNCGALESLTIGNSVTSIGNGAFRNCGTLESVTIPNSVISIGDRAFYGCVNLQTLTIGNSVTTIGAEAFMYCDNLTTLSIPNSVTSIGDRAFSDCINLTTLTFGNSVTTIGIESFSGCISLTSLTIPNSVTSIGDRAFLLFDQLSEIHSLASTPSSLGNEVFYNTDETIPVYVPCGTVSAYRNAFGWNNFTNIQEEPTCTHTVTVTVDNPAMGTVTGDGTYTVGTTATLTATPNCGYRFVHWTSNSTPVSADNPYSFNVTKDTTLTALFEAVATTGIQQECSTGQTLIYSIDCSNLTATITGHGDNCTGTLAIPESIIVNGIEFSVTAIGEQAFKDCSGLTGTLTIPSSVTTIGNGAFQGCSGFTGTLTIPSSVTSIGIWAFSSCSGFTGIVVENGNPQYDSRNNCNAIINASNTLVAGCQNTVIPNTVTTIGDGAFNGCTTLTSVTIPTSVTRIDWWAFSGCTGLTTLTLPGSVTNLGNYAFAFCGNLTEITSLAEEPPVANADVFLDSPKTIPVNVPCGKVSPYRNAAGWSDFENIQEMDGCTHTVTATSADEAMGSVTGGGSYPHGGEATLTATPNVGYHFVQWNDGNHDNPRSLTVTHDTTFTASFAPTTVYTTVDTSVCNNKFPFIWNGLTITAAGSQTATLQNHLGADSIVTINVHLNYTSAGDTTAVEFDHFTWYGHTYHQSTSTPTHLLTNAAGCDSTVTLHLTINPSHLGEFEITATADDAAKGTVSGGGRFDAGQEVTLAASANCGYQFLQWSDGSTHNPRTVTVAGNATYTAQFQQANYIFETPSGQMLNYAVDCNTQTACVTGYTGLCRGLLVIPPLIRIEGVIYVVVSIGPSAFENNTGLLRVMIPGTVDAIYESAFRGCTNLAKVEGWYQLKGLE